MRVIIITAVLWGLMAVAIGCFGVLLHPEMMIDRDDKPHPVKYDRLELDQHGVKHAHA